MSDGYPNTTIPRTVFGNAITEADMYEMMMMMMIHSTRVNYASNLAYIHGLDTMVG